MKIRKKVNEIVYLMKFVPCALKMSKINGIADIYRLTKTKCNEE